MAEATPSMGLARRCEAIIDVGHRIQHLWKSLIILLNCH